MYRLRTALQSVAVITLVVVAASASGCAASKVAAQPMFIGDYSTGDFSQWPSVQNRGYNGPGAGYVPSYSATVVHDPVKNIAARFEVRSGDWPGFASGERSDVGAVANNTGGTEGQIRWYEFSTMFDPSFPQNHADLAGG